MRQLLSASVCDVSLSFLTVVSAGAATRTVCASGCADTDLQAAIDAAVFGDTILLPAGQTFVDIRLDGLYVHGDPYKRQKRGITPNGKRLGVLNSYIADIKAIDIGSQAILGYNGPRRCGPPLHTSRYVCGPSLLVTDAAGAVGSASTTVTARWGPEREREFGS